MKSYLTVIVLFLLFLHSSFSQNIQWATIFGGPVTEYCHSVSVGPENGEITTVGGYYDSLAINGSWTSVLTGLNLYISRLSPTGALLWHRHFGGPLWDMAIDVVQDQEGNTYITGFFEQYITFDNVNLVSQGGLDIYILKLDENGQTIWARSIGGNFHDYGYGLALDEEGHLYLTGVTESVSVAFGNTLITNPNGTSQGYLAKLDPDGNIEWCNALGGDFYDNSWRVRTGPQGAIWLIGEFSGTANFGNLTLDGAQKNLFVGQLDEEGNWLWVTSAGSDQTLSMWDIAIDEAGSAFVVGSFTDEATFGEIPLTGIGLEDAFIARISSEGEWKWVRSFGDFDGISVGRSVEVNDQGKIFFWGEFGPSIVLAGEQIQSQGQSDALLMQLNPHGQLIAYQTFGSEDPEYGDQGIYMTRDADGQLLLAGRFTQTITFNGEEWQSEGGRDVYLIKMDADLMTTGIADQVESMIQLVCFPNPANKQIQVHWKEAEERVTEISVFKTDGQLMMYQTVEEKIDLIINVATWPAGSYFLKWTTESGRGGKSSFIIAR